MGDFFSKCREAKCCAVIATQTYESFVAKLKNEHVAAQLLANLRTKIWLCAEDNYTARQAADLCGEIERRKVSRSRNETAKLSAFSFLDGEVIAADPGAVGEGVSISLRREHLFTPRAFTSLMVNQAIAKAFDGVRVLEPWVVYLKPMHENPELSWFETTGRVAGEPGTATAHRWPETLVRAASRVIERARKWHRSWRHGERRARPRPVATRSERETEEQEDRHG
jgi:hypothetical protein